MKDFQSSLLREKFIIAEVEDTKADPLIAVSNRMSITLHNDISNTHETFILRTQNMHSCTRLAAAALKKHHQHKTSDNYLDKNTWDIIWNDVIKGYERDWNQNIWCAIYYKGRIVHQDGQHHPFLDIIEQCDAAQKNEYSESVILAEEIFSKAGKKIKIDHDSNVALILSIKEDVAKAGIIVRSGANTTTFNFNAEAKDEKHPLHPYTIISVAASFLESIQLGFQVGLMNKKQEFGLYEPFSDESRKHKRTTTRLGNLNRAIDLFEQNYHINYRPERPTSKSIVTQAEEDALKFLKPEIEEKFNSGEIDKKDWVV